MIASIGLAVVLAQAGLCVDPTADWPFDPRDRESCPQVYRVSGGASSDEALDIVVLSAGFAEEELDRFRCGTQLMVERLLEFPPFDCYAESINFYRIDLAGRSGVSYDQCSPQDHCGPTEFLPSDWPANECKTHSGGFGVPLRGAGQFSGDCMRLDLNVGACPDGAPWCKVFWPADDGDHSLLWQLLALCAPQFDVALILVNSLDSAGGGIEDMAAHHGLAVTTLNGITNKGTRSKVLAHELGHTLGLLDEYHDLTTYGNGITPPEFHSGRNVVGLNKDDSMADVPWAAMCTDAEGTVTGKCLVHCDDCTQCPVTTAGPGTVGLYEGGFYEACRYFKASNDLCRMEDQVNEAYCAGCRHHLAEFFKELHMKSSCP